MMQRSLAFAAVSLAALVACSSSEDGARSTLTVTIAGESAALAGFPFPAQDADEPSFVDGWSVRFDRILVTVGEITLADGPDTSPTDQSVTGPVVSRARGPWAVDLTRPGAAGAEAFGKNPDAQRLASFESLDPASRYAFGFDFVVATSEAQRTNLDADAEGDYADMIARGWSVLYVGAATFKGTDCKASDPAYDFSRLPKTVKFRLGFHSPVRYVNCQNTDLKGRPFDGEEAQRGVQVLERGDTVAQITLHVDHPFWSTVDHDAAELYFDQIAAAATPDGDVTLDDLSALDFTSFRDRAGAALPWRSCLAAKPPREGTRKFDSGSVPVDPTASPEAALRHYGDYVHYQQSTEGHLNADGLCAVTRLYPSPR